MFRQRVMFPIDFHAVRFVRYRHWLSGWLTQWSDAGRTRIQFIVNPQSRRKAEHGAEQSRRLARRSPRLAHASSAPICIRATRSHFEANHAKQEPKPQSTAE